MQQHPPEGRLKWAHYDAVIFDLDGVITRTAGVHAAAWKAMFDEYLKQRAASSGLPFEPFDIQRDYFRHVDGKPRYEGVKSFLTSRGIELPFGRPDDAPDVESVCGLGKRKNRLFLDLIEQQGVSTYPSTLRLIHWLRAEGKKIAVVSSSRNCAAILDTAGIAGLFEARVDGTDIGPQRLKGKPAADIFIEAARRLGVEPERAVVVEDALAGVEAGRRGGFGCVVGVDRAGQANALRARGADIVVADLAELYPAPPSALAHLEAIAPPPGKQLAMFLDYDGTLTPIVAHPDLALISERMRATLERLARHCSVAIISGRDLADVKRKVGLPGIYYAGSHGFDIAGPDERHIEFQQGLEYLPVLDRAQAELAERLKAVEGCLVERKRFSIAVHYRQVAEAGRDRVKAVVEQVRDTHPELRLSGGKMVHELQPDIDWDKGKALHWLLRTLEMDSPAVIPLYLGDDLTDEDAFRAIDDDGIGIVVAEKPRQTRARYRLKEPQEVQRFLDELISHLETDQ